MLERDRFAGNSESDQSAGSFAVLPATMGGFEKGAGGRFDGIRQGMGFFALGEVVEPERDDRDPCFREFDRLIVSVKGLRGFKIALIAAAIIFDGDTGDAGGGERGKDGSLVERDGVLECRVCCLEKIDDAVGNMSARRGRGDLQQCCRVDCVGFEKSFLD